MLAAVQSQLATEGISVKESEMLKEPSSNISREIDVVVRGELAGQQITIALECRDHEAVQDVTWIDELAGKFRDLPIDTVVAVSASGFTVAALSKAKALGIRTVAFGVPQADAHLSSIAFADVKGKIIAASYKVDPVFASVPTDLWNRDLVDHGGTRVESVGGLVRSVLTNACKVLPRDLLERKPPNIVMRRGSGTFLLIAEPEGSLFVKEGSGASHRLVELAIAALLTVTPAKTSVRSSLLGRQSLSIVEAQLEKGSLKFAMLIDPVAKTTAIVSPEMGGQRVRVRIERQD
jgi:hypothetical protein